MNVGEILRKAGGVALSAAFPGVGAQVINLINEFLPAEDKLGVDASGAEAEGKLSGLDSSDRAALLGKEIDLKIATVTESYGALKMMLEFEQKNQQSTRPKIAYQSFQVVGSSIIMLVAAIVVKILDGSVDVLNIWPTVLSILAPLVVLLHAYFGILRDEKSKLISVTGVPETKPTGLVSKLGKIIF